MVVTVVAKAKEATVAVETVAAEVMWCQSTKVVTFGMVMAAESVG